MSVRGGVRHEAATGDDGTPEEAGGRKAKNKPGYAGAQNQPQGKNVVPLQPGCSRRLFHVAGAQIPTGYISE